MFRLTLFIPSSMRFCMDFGIRPSDLHFCNNLHAKSRLLGLGQVAQWRQQMANMFPNLLAKLSQNQLTKQLKNDSVLEAENEAKITPKRRQATKRPGPTAGFIARTPCTESVFAAFVLHVIVARFGWSRGTEMSL